jgi:hypothetical protein
MIWDNHDEILNVIGKAQCSLGKAQCSLAKLM